MQRSNQHNPSPPTGEQHVEGDMLASSVSFQHKNINEVHDGQLIHIPNKWAEEVDCSNG